MIPVFSLLLLFSMSHYSAQAQDDLSSGVGNSQNQTVVLEEQSEMVVAASMRYVSSSNKLVIYYSADTETGGENFRQNPHSQSLVYVCADPAKGEKERLYVFKQATDSSLRPGETFRFRILTLEFKD